MAIPDSELTTDLSGRRIDPLKMNGHVWHDQGASNHHFGFPRTPGLYVRRITSVLADPDEPAMLFVLMQVDDAGLVTEVSTAIYHPFNDGSFVEVEQEFFFPDRDVAREACLEVLEGAA